MASPKPLADQLGYLIGMRLSFKSNVTCRPWIRDEINYAVITIATLCVAYIESVMPWFSCRAAITLQDLPVNLAVSSRSIHVAYCCAVFLFPRFLSPLTPFVPPSHTWLAWERKSVKDPVWGWVPIRRRGEESLVGCQGRSHEADDIFNRNFNTLYARIAHYTYFSPGSDVLQCRKGRPVYSCWTIIIL